MPNKTNIMRVILDEVTDPAALVKLYLEHGAYSVVQYIKVIPQRRHPISLVLPCDWARLVV
jgi:hypothetical protein